MIVHHILTRRFLSVLLCSLIVVTGCSSPSRSETDTETTADVQTLTLKGDNRYETCAAIVEEVWPDGADTAILVTGEKFPDALAASAVSGALNAPILMSRLADLPDPIASLLADSWNGRVKTVLCIGAGFSDSVMSRLRECGVRKIDSTSMAGVNRYDTANKVCRYGLRQGWFTTDRVVLAVGTKAADALSFSTWCHADRLPLLLTDGNHLTQDTKDLLNTFDHVIVLGSENAVSGKVAEEAGLVLDGQTDIRIGGANRYDTCRLVSEAMTAVRTQMDSALPYRGMENLETVVLAPGTDDHFPDALMGGCLAELGTGPVLLMDQGKSSADMLECADTLAVKQETSRTCRLGAVDGELALNAETLFKRGGGWILTQYGDSSGVQLMSYALVDGQGHLILIDGGYDTDEDKATIRHLLKTHNNHADLWILTHPHPDHAGAFNGLMTDTSYTFTVDEILTVSVNGTRYRETARSYDGYDTYVTCQAILDTQDNVIYGHEGQTLNRDGLTLTILNAWDDSVDAETVDLCNDGSLVFTVESDQAKALFLADIGVKREASLTANHADELRADIVQTAHHGNSGLSNAFYDRIGADTAFFDMTDELMANPLLKAEALRQYLESKGTAVKRLSDAPHSVII